jgi:tetratricopeptide (TPR) repeat protein
MDDFPRAVALHREGRLDEAAALYEAILESDPGHAEAAHHLSLLLCSRGSLDRAEELARKGVVLEPASGRALAHLGSVLLALGHPGEALGFLEAALSIDPSRADVLNNLGAALRSAGRLDEALENFKRALELSPAYADARFNLAGLLTKCERYAESIPQYELLLESSPHSAQAHYALGQALWKADRSDEALEQFEQTIAIDPAFTNAYAAKANVLTESGQFAEAVAALERAIDLEPDRGEFYRFLAEVRPSAVTAQHLGALEDLARKNSSLSDDMRIDANFALGKIYANAGDRVRSLDHLIVANAHKRRFIEYDEYDTLESFHRIAATFDADFLASRRGCSDASSTPIFIFGMPRSGTTLIEQVLASHPNVYGAGELSLFSDIATAVLADGATISPAGMRDAPCARLREVGRRYVDALTQLAPAFLRITDKMPANFTHAGLIHMVLPNARMIHAMRDPVDTCMSCFGHYFAGGQPWAYDLAELGRYYRGYATLMEHWRTVLDDAAMLEVRYEDVVEDVEAQARRIIAYCGLEWDDGCLQFHKTERRVKTASATQVRQPIYRTSVRGWRDHEHTLQPLIQALGQRYGAR